MTGMALMGISLDVRSPREAIFVPGHPDLQELALMMPAKKFATAPTLVARFGRTRRATQTRLTSNGPPHVMGANKNNNAIHSFPGRV